MSNVEKVRTLFRGIAERDAALVAAQIDPDRYVEHDPNLGDGAEGLARYVAEFKPDDHLRLVRVLEDGDCVVAQADGRVRGDATFFDVFRFEHGRIVEHRGFAARPRDRRTGAGTRRPTDRPSPGRA